MILQNAFILSLIVYFIHVCFYWEGMIFEKVGEWMEIVFPDWWRKPFLFACPICSTPWWGFAFYGILNAYGVKGFEDVKAASIIATLFTGAGIAVLLVIASKFFTVLKLMEDERTTEDQG